MKARKQEAATVVAPTESEIRDYAQHLYEQSGCKPGHDLENWLEAKACLEANIPKHQTRGRLHRHRHPTAMVEEIEYASVEVHGGGFDPLGEPENALTGVVVLHAPNPTPHRTTKRT